MSKVQNFQLTRLASSMRTHLPNGYFAGIVLSYLANAALMVYFLHSTFSVLVPNFIVALSMLGFGAVVIQFFRFLIVFTDQLLPTGKQTSKAIIQLVALGMFIFSSIEIYHAVDAVQGLAGAQFWSLTMFGWAITFGGYILEISFIRKMNELTDIEVADEVTISSDDYDRLQQELLKEQQLRKRAEDALMGKD